MKAIIRGAGALAVVIAFRRPGRAAAAPEFMAWAGAYDTGRMEMRRRVLHEGLILEFSPGPAHGVLRAKVLGTRATFEIARRAVPAWAAERADRAILDLARG